jgi:hypothetical protein
VPRSSLFWAVLAVALAGAALYAPAYVARAATGPGEPVDFLKRPEEGWRFVLAAVRAVPSARLSRPALAAEQARRVFAGQPIQPTRVTLLYLPDRVVTVGRGKGRRRLAANARLIWRIVGRVRPGGPLVTVGLMDFSSGALIYDVRKPA